MSVTTGESAKSRGGSAIFDALQRTAVGIGSKAHGHRARLVELGLETYANELDAYGYTVVPPERVSTPDHIDAVRDAVVRVATERTGVEHAVGRNGAYGALAGVGGDNQYLLFYLLFEDRLFEDWLDNPTLRALVRSTMRGTAQLSSMVSFVKWQGEGYGPGLGLHSDSPGSPEGVLPSTHDAVCNAALLLTDYTVDDGALAVVPGSHLLCRQPGPGDGIGDAVAVEAPAGSLVFWHGNTWHGAYPKKTGGLRLNLTTYFCNRAYKTQERYGAAVPDEVLARHDAEFARLLGADDVMGWDAAGPDYRRAAKYAGLRAGDH